LGTVLFTAITGIRINDMTAEREMTLHEWVGKLPEIHLARKELVAMHERIAELESKWTEAIGWAYADCCATLDAGGDPRQTEMSDVLLRATIDLGEGE
jgi:hypothetical protein